MYSFKFFILFILEYILNKKTQFLYIHIKTYERRRFEEANDNLCRVRNKIFVRKFEAKEDSFWMEKDLINTKIIIPKNGLFLVVDWNESEENKHEVNSLQRMEK